MLIIIINYFQKWIKSLYNFCFKDVNHYRLQSSICKIIWYLMLKTMLIIIITYIPHHWHLSQNLFKKMFRITFTTINHQWNLLIIIVLIDAHHYHHLHSTINENSQQFLFSKWSSLFSFTIPTLMKFLYSSLFSRMLIIIITYNSINSEISSWLLLSKMLFLSSITFKHWWNLFLQFLFLKIVINITCIRSLVKSLVY
jgi:hypothetical protein